MSILYGNIIIHAKPGPVANNDSNTLADLYCRMQLKSITCHRIVLQIGIAYYEYRERYSERTIVTTFIKFRLYYISKSFVPRFVCSVGISIHKYFENIIIVMAKCRMLHILSICYLLLKYIAFFKFTLLSCSLDMSYQLT